MTEAEQRLWSAVYAAVWPASGCGLADSWEVACREADRAVGELRKRVSPPKSDMVYGPEETTMTRLEFDAMLKAVAVRDFTEMRRIIDTAKARGQ
jgi:hypothetical protein